MKEYSTKDIRNVVLIGSAKSGKTTLSEAMLFEGKVIARRGTVEDKNTVSDNEEIEKINQRSIFATPLYAEFMNTKFNVIDAPGSDDFIGGAVSAFKVCENGILVINAQQGVEVGTDIFARYADKYKLPLIVAVNQLDSEKADWEKTIAEMKETFGHKPIIVQFPVNPGPSFDGFIDVLKMKYYHFKDDNGTREDLDIPANLMDEAETLRQELIEKAAEFDDTLMERFFENGWRASYLLPLRQEGHRCEEAHGVHHQDRHLPGRDQVCHQGRQCGRVQGGESYFHIHLQD